MLDFEIIWSKFDWVIDDMKDGMCFFEGYIPSIDQSCLDSKLSEIAKVSQSYNLGTSVWSDSATEAEWEKEYSIPESIDHFRKGKIVLLHFNYEKKINKAILNFKLIFEKSNEAVTALDIICYREPILRNIDPKGAIEKSINELCLLKRLFHGDSLFIGPDNLNYPKNKDDIPKEWLKIE
jgi:hypothetical protein